MTVKLLTLKEAAARYSISSGALQKAIDRGSLHIATRQRGRRNALTIYVTPKAVEAYLASVQARKELARQRREAIPNPPGIGMGRGIRPGRRKTHCSRGHEFTPENTRCRSNGENRAKTKVCKTCDSERSREYYWARKRTRRQ